MFRWERVCSGGRECVKVGESVFRWVRVCSDGRECVQVGESLFRWERVWVRVMRN